MPITTESFISTGERKQGQLLFCKNSTVLLSYNSGSYSHYSSSASIGQLVILLPNECSLLNSKSPQNEASMD